MEKNKSLIILSLTSVTGMIIGQLYFPFALFIAIAPLITISKLDHKLSDNHFDFLVLGLLLISELCVGIGKSVSPLFGVAHAIVLWLTFVLFSFTDRHAKNKLGIFTLIIYWLGAEYVSLLIFSKSSYLLLGSGFDGYSLIDWGGYTGLTGISTWILFGNVFLYYALFYDEQNILTGKIRILSICYSIIGITLPIIILAFNTYEPSIITAETAMALFENKKVEIEPYATDGEVVARSIGWVSVLIAIYAVVKRKVR